MHAITSTTSRAEKEYLQRSCSRLATLEESRSLDNLLIFVSEIPSDNPWILGTANDHPRIELKLEYSSIPTMDAYRIVYDGRQWPGMMWMDWRYNERRRACGQLHGSRRSLTCRPGS